LHVWQEHRSHVLGFKHLIDVVKVLFTSLLDQRKIT
jgi:hypothetical protein